MVEAYWLETPSKIPLPHGRDQSRREELLLSTAVVDRAVEVMTLSEVQPEGTQDDVSFLMDDVLGWR